MKGKITELKQNEKNFFFKIDSASESFSGYGRAEFVVGDQVEFNVDVKKVGDKTYYNAKQIDMISADEPEKYKTSISDPMDMQTAAEYATQLTIKVKQLCELNGLEGMRESQTLVTARLALGLGQ